MNIADRYGSTPLREASNFGQDKCVKILIQAGADVNSSDVSSNSPLITAAKRGHYKVVALLLQAGVNINKHNKLLINAIASHITRSFGVREDVLLLLYAAGKKLSFLTSNETPTILQHREIKTQLKHVQADNKKTFTGA